MASWQASLVSLLYRLTAKSALRSNGSIESLRRQMERFSSVLGKLPADARVEPVQFPTFEADWISVPESDPRRVILHFPGGAYIMRFPTIHRALAARICRQARARALLVHYRLAPEDPYPAGLRDCMTAYRALLDQGVPASHIVIGGDSAGGGMALSSLLALPTRAHPCRLAFTFSRR
jgi:acetyl esterase/lipase